MNERALYGRIKIKKTTARNHELESWPHTGKQLMTPPGEPTVISEDIIYQKHKEKDFKVPDYISEVKY